MFAVCCMFPPSSYPNTSVALAKRYSSEVPRMNLGGWMDRNDAAGRSEGTREREQRGKRESVCVCVCVQRRDVVCVCDPKYVIQIRTHISLHFFKLEYVFPMF